jgi:hypothetical protein
MQRIGMRRSTVVQLTLLPMLATAAVAAADPPAVGEAPLAVEVTAPGMTAPVMSPPGMTPGITELDCQTDPNWRLRTDCDEYEPGGYYYQGGVIRGGFGGYFWTGGG